MLRKSFAVVFALSIVACGSSGSSNEEVLSNDQALETECDPALLACPDEATAPVAARVTVTGWDSTTGNLFYTDASGVATSSVVTATTRIRRAPILQFEPSDPMLPVAQSWNALVRAPGPNVFGTVTAPPEGVTTPSSLTSLIAQLGGHMRVKLRLDGTVKALRVVP